MKLILSLSVLAVALLMVLEGPAPAQADSVIPQEVQTLWGNMKNTVREAFESIDWKWFPDTFDKVKEKIQKTFS